MRANAVMTWKLLSNKEKEWCRGAESNCRHHDFQFGLRLDRQSFLINNLPKH